MKNNLVLTLAQVFTNASANTVDAKDAYKFLKMKSEILKAQKAIGEHQEELAKECFKDDEERNLAADPNSEKSDELKAKIAKFNNLFAELIEDETELNIKKVSFESWHAFSKENDLKLGMLECELEDVLFLPDPERE